MQQMSFARFPLVAAVLANLFLAVMFSPVFGIVIGAPALIGEIRNTSLDEISGLVASHVDKNVLWVHNDSGDIAQFYAMSVEGEELGSFPLAGATARDWEDIAIGPKSGGGNYLYLGDIGDNSAVRSNIVVHRTVEPLSTTGTTIPVGGYKSLGLQYPNGPRDAESMFVDPLLGDLYIITKRQLIPELYRVSVSAFESSSQTLTLTALGTFPEIPFFATAADISPDGRFILVRSSTSSFGYLYERGWGQSVADALHSPGMLFTLGAESQGEAIGWAADGKSFYTTSEIDSRPYAPIYSYSFSAPPLLPGDYNNDHIVDAADYAMWRNHLGEEIELANESETPGVVTSHDYTVWKAHFGQSLGGDAAAAKTGVVPEPGNWWLAVSGCALAITALRRKNRWR